jgi:hypothetical protein
LREKARMRVMLHLSLLSWWKEYSYLRLAPGLINLANHR